jgi:putative tricarboxylic transport membrane protein
MGRLPESANNAKEGGALIPMLFLGIPGSGSMALLLGGLVLIGLTPGRTMVTDHVDLVYVIHVCRHLETRPPASCVRVRS